MIKAYSYYLASALALFFITPFFVGVIDMWFWVVTDRTASGINWFNDKIGVSRVIGVIVLAAVGVVLMGINSVNSTFQHGKEGSK